MNTWADLLWGLIRMGAVAAAVFYALDVLLTYSRSQGGYRLAIDRDDFLGSAHHVSLWAGTRVVGFVVRVTRPFLNELAEASAEVGEWAMARHESNGAARPRQR